jgi:hypothetical protein
VSFETLLLNRLKTAQQEFAFEALNRPQNRDAFEYGHRVGVVEGYEAAINLLLNLVNEDKYGERDI